MVREVGRDDLLENGLQFRFQLIDAPGRRPECVVPPAHRLLDVRQDLATDVRIIVLLQQGDQDKAVDADAGGYCRIDLDELPRRDVVVPLWFANSLDVGKRRVGVPDEDDEIGAIVPDLVGLDHAAEFTQHESCHGRSLLAQRPTFCSGWTCRRGARWASRLAFASSLLPNSCRVLLTEALEARVRTG